MEVHLNTKQAKQRKFYKDCDIIHTRSNHILGVCTNKQFDVEATKATISPIQQRSAKEITLYYL